MIEISFQRILLMPNSVRLARFLPSKSTSPETMRPFSGSSLRIARAAVVLPQPLLAGQAQAAGPAHHEAHAVDGLHIAVAQLEVGLQVAHVQDAVVGDALAGRLAGVAGPDFIVALRRSSGRLVRAVVSVTVQIRRRRSSPRTTRRRCPP